jgi:hypothetical protein
MTRVMVFVCDIGLILKPHTGHVSTGKECHFLIIQVFHFTKIYRNMHPMIVHAFVEGRSLPEPFDNFLLFKVWRILQKVFGAYPFGFALDYLLLILSIFPDNSFFSQVVRVSLDTINLSSLRSWTASSIKSSSDRFR